MNTIGSRTMTALVIAGLLASGAAAHGDLPFEDWTAIGPGTAGFVGTISDPTNALHIVGVGQNALLGGYCLETTDGGLSWATKSTGFSFNPDSAFSAFDQHRMYVGAVSNCWRTLDGGNTWMRSSYNTRANMRTICVHPTDNNTVFVAGEDGLGGLILGKSGDAGQSWVPTTHPVGVVNRVYGLAVSPSNPDYMLVCGYKSSTIRAALVLLSTDGGTSWNDLSATVDRQDNNLLRTAAFDPNDHRRMYVAGKYFYSSADGGISWQQSAAVSNIRTIGVDPYSGKIYATYDRPVLPSGVGLLSSKDYGNSWTPSESNVSLASPYYIEVMRANPAYLLISGGTAMFKSEDAGQTLVRADPRATFNSVYSIAVAPSGPSRIWASTVLGMFRSDNGGDDWTAITRPGDGSGYGSVAPDNPDLLLWVGADG